VKAARQNPANVQVTNGIYGIPDAMIEITLLGTGTPIPDPNRAGPATLVRAGGQAFLVDCGRGVLQRAAAIGLAATGLSALLLTHLHSDHIADLGDVMITRWITTFAPDPVPLRSSDRPEPPRWSRRR
jgi:ribonuclease Z